MDFIVLEEEIREFLAQGISLRAIHRYLKDKGRLNMSYNTLLKLNKHCRAIRSAKPVQAAPPSPKSAPVGTEPQPALGIIQPAITHHKTPESKLLPQ